LSCHTSSQDFNRSSQLGRLGREVPRAGSVCRWFSVMRKVFAVVACGLSVAACSASIPDFLKSSPPKAALRFESVPTGAEVKVSGQSCRTPCELTLDVAELSATFAHKGYQPQTISVRSEKSEGLFAPPRFVPNPVHADLQPVGTSAKRQQRKETPVAAENPPGPVSPEARAPSSTPAYGEVK